MDFQVTAKNVELTQAVRDYINRKLSKHDRHLHRVLESKVELQEEKTKSAQQRYVVQVTIDSNGVILRGEERAGDLFTAIDKVAEVMERQAEHYKGKRETKKTRNTSFARTGLNTETEAAPPLEKLVKVKRFAIKPMPLDEAIDQMELLGHDFFLFLNAENEKPNLLYRRKDGNYGLIEPEIS